MDQSEANKSAAEETAKATADAKAAAEAKVASKAKPAHLALEYTGPLTCEQAADRHRIHGEKLFDVPETKPATVKATK